MPDELMPYSQEAEEAVLGSIIIDPECLRGLELLAGDFYIHKNSIIFEHARTVQDSGKNLDYITLEDALKQAGKFAEIGGQNYLLALISGRVTSMNVDSYAEIVRGRARQRRVIAAAHKLTSAGFSGKDLDKTVSEAVTELVTASAGKNGAVHWSEYLSRLYDEVGERAKNPLDIFGIATGMQDFDRITGGFQPKESTIISGEPGLGKSLLAMQWAEGMAKNGNPGAVYELEMNAIQVVRRAVANKSKIQTRRMRTGKLQDGDWQSFTGAVEALSALPVYISDYPHWTTLAIKADLARLKDRAGIKWFVVDYMELLSDVYGNGNDVDRTKFISGQIKGICKDLGLAGITIQGMNKAGISGEQKGKAGLAGSVKISYDADNIWILRRRDNDKEIRLDAEKLREGDGAGDFVDLIKLDGFPAFGQKARL